MSSSVVVLSLMLVLVVCQLINDIDGCRSAPLGDWLLGLGLSGYVV